MEQGYLDNEAHKESLRPNRLKMLATNEKIQTVPLFEIADTQKTKLTDKMGKLVVQLYNDAKCLSFSSHSWPSRVVASEIAHQFDFKSPFQSYDASFLDLQYVTPGSYEDILRMVIAFNAPRIIKVVDKCLAVQLTNGKCLQYPLLKSVSAVHSWALAFKALCKEVTKVDVLVRKLSGFSSFFHISAAGTTELEKLPRSIVSEFATCQITLR